MSAEPIYLDHNATTPVHAEVRDAMLPWLGERFGNPSSSHVYGRAAAQAVAQGREAVATLVGGSAAQIVFTGCGTEADNLALLGSRPVRRRLVTSAVEHPAIDGPAEVLRERGFVCEQLPVSRDGRVDMDAAAALLREPAGLLSVMLAQNETGAIQPVAELAAMARAAAADVLVHSDAAQAVGKIPVDVEPLGVDMLTIVAHKLYGPCGIAALWVRDGVELHGLTSGGGQERGVRPGTQPVALIVGLGAACSLASRDLVEQATRQRGLRETLWARLRDGVDGIVRTAEGVETLPNTLHVCFPGVAGRDVLQHAPRVAATVGSACHDGAGAASGALGAMGLTAAEAAGAVRLSMGRSTTAEDIEIAAAALVEAYGATRR